jgi:hypothetical protein
MMIKIRFLSAIATGCALFATLTLPARAQSTPGSWNLSIGPSSTQVAGVALGIAGAGAAIGIGVFYAVHHGHNLTGCVASEGNGLELLTDSDHKTYALNGEVADIKPGERIHVAGRKSKKSSAVPPSFLVEKVSKEYGPCEVMPATR